MTATGDTIDGERDGRTKRDLRVEIRRNKIKDINYIYIDASVFIVEILNY